MSQIQNWCRSLYLRYFAKPAHERKIYAHIHRSRPTSIVEFGVRDGVRSMRMLASVVGRSRPSDVRFVGIDWFEAGSGEDRLSLKEAHRLMKPMGVQLSLFPGDPFSVLARQANRLARIDLIVIGLDQDSESLEQAWFYLPRMLHEQSTVFIETCVKDHSTGDDATEESTLRFIKLSRQELLQRCGDRASHISKAA